MDKNWWYRIGFILVKSALIYLLFKLPNSTLTSIDGEMDENTFGYLILFGSASTILFYFLQGSNPGYILQHPHDDDTDGHAFIINISPEHY